MKMLTRMRERLEAKLGNSNDNAFKLRKLFKMYDVRSTGKVRQDALHVLSTFGILDSIRRF